MNKLLRLSTLAISMMTNSQAMQEMYQERDLEYEVEYRENLSKTALINKLCEESAGWKQLYKDCVQENDECYAEKQRLKEYYEQKLCEACRKIEEERARRIEAEKIIERLRHSAKDSNE